MEKKKKHTQICRWNGLANAINEQKEYSPLFLSMWKKVKSEIDSLYGFWNESEAVNNHHKFKIHFLYI